MSFQLSKQYQADLERLVEWLSIASISSESKYAPEMKQAADWIVTDLNQLGFDSQVVKTSSHPAVISRYISKNPKAKTVLIYGHYDVQAPEPLDEWKTKPFKPTIIKGNLYARGAADDKGQLYTWIAAVRQLLSQGDLDLNLTFLIEGAEEEGSQGLAECVKTYKSELEAEVCLISDSHSLSLTQPVLTYGLRGLCYFDVVVETAKQDAHSGIYGGNIANAANELSWLITKLKDDGGAVQIPQFYRDVRKLSKKEKTELADYPWSIEDIILETGVAEVVGESNRSLAERAGARPTLDVNGLWSGYTGEGTKTIIPAKASAKISMRLVPHQDPNHIESQFKSYIQSLARPGVKVTVKSHLSEPAVLMDRDSQYFQAASKAMSQTFGNPPVYELSGGSIGVVSILQQELGIDSVLMGYGLPDDNLHAPNEKLSLEMFEKGIETNKVFLKSIR